MDHVPDPRPRALRVLDQINSLNYSLPDFLVELFSSSDPAAEHATAQLRPCRDFLIFTLFKIGSTPQELLESTLRVTQFTRVDAIASILNVESAVRTEAIALALPLFHELDPATTVEWSLITIMRVLSNEIARMTRPAAGFHGNVRNLSPEQLESFNLIDIVNQMAASGPTIWRLILHLLGASDSVSSAYKEHAAGIGLEADGVDDLLADEATDNLNSTDGHEGLSGAAGRATPTSGAGRRGDLLTMRAATTFAIFLQANSQHANLLQTFFGAFLFLHHTQDKAMTLLNHVGISVSRASLQKAMSSLNAHHAARMRSLGATHLYQLCFDNFNFHERVSVPTLERQSSYVSMISALAIRSHPDITAADFAHVDHLYRLNPAVRLPRVGAEEIREEFRWLYMQELPEKLLHRMARLKDEDPVPFNMGQYWQETYQYHVLDLLMRHHPRFKKYKNLLGPPAVVYPVPPTRTEWEPLRAMDLNQASNDDTIAALENIFRQLGQTVEDSEGFVTFVHGDLTGAERVLSALRTRAFEKSALDQFRNVKPVMGLFHACLASAESIQPIVRAQIIDDTQQGIIKYIRQLRPGTSDQNKFKPANDQKAPPYRLAHDTHTHLAAAMAYEAIRHEAHEQDLQLSTLDSLADQLDQLPPSEAFGVIQSLASQVARRCVASSQLPATRKRPAEERDKVFENTQIYLRHVLLHLELTTSIKIQDTGRVLICLCRFMFIWAGCGKFKYAAHTLSMLSDLESAFPDSILKAFLYSWTVNLSGKSGDGRAVDWLNELFNFYIKVMHCGCSSNFGREHMSQMSALIRMHKIIFESFVLQYHLHSTKKHAQPDMHETLEKLAETLREDKAVEFCADRRSGVEVKDTLAAGQVCAHTGKLKPATAGDNAPIKILTLELEDFSIDTLQ